MNDRRKETRILDISEHSDIKGFFYEQIQLAQKSCKVRLSENVEFYLVQLLSDFLRIGEHTAINECLAEMLAKAAESPPGEQIVLYKKLADKALYFSGFYQQYFSNKAFSIKYYISLGQSAYQTLSSLMGKQSTQQKTLTRIYQNMSDNFLQSVDILLCVSEQTNQTSKNRSVLNIYETWIDTKSEKLENSLLEKGIMPIPNLDTRTQ